MAICNIIYDLANVQCCFHCGSGKADKKRLKCINIDTKENLFLFVCFGFKCINSYLCNNCSHALLSFGKKCINIKQRCELAMQNILRGNKNTKTMRIMDKSPCLMKTTPTHLPVFKRQCTPLSTDKQKKKAKRNLFDKG